MELRPECTPRAYGRTNDAHRTGSISLVQWTTGGEAGAKRACDLPGVSGDPLTPASPAQFRPPGRAALPDRARRPTCLIGPRRGGRVFTRRSVRLVGPSTPERTSLLPPPPASALSSCPRRGPEQGRVPGGAGGEGGGGPARGGRWNGTPAWNGARRWKEGFGRCPRAGLLRARARTPRCDG